MHGEWRIAASEEDSEVKFIETIPNDCLIEGAPDATAAVEAFKPWEGTDLSSGAWDAPVIVWQW